MGNFLSLAQTLGGAGSDLGQAWAARRQMRQEDFFNSLKAMEALLQMQQLQLQMKQPRVLGTFEQPGGKLIAAIQDPQTGAVKTQEIYGGYPTQQFDERAKGLINTLKPEDQKTASGIWGLYKDIDPMQGLTALLKFVDQQVRTRSSRAGAWFKTPDSITGWARNWIDPSTGVTTFTEKDVLPSAAYLPGSTTGISLVPMDDGTGNIYYKAFQTTRTTGKQTGAQPSGGTPAPGAVPGTGGRVRELGTLGLKKAAPGAKGLTPQQAVSILLRFRSQALQIRANQPGAYPTSMDTEAIADEEMKKAGIDPQQIRRLVSQALQGGPAAAVSDRTPGTAADYLRKNAAGTTTQP